MSDDRDLEISTGWRELRAWRAPQVSARVEAALREDFRRRHRRWWPAPLWAGRAALVVLALGATILARVGGRGGESESPRPAIHAGVAWVALDLSGFQVLRQARVRRGSAGVTEADLGGFVPLRTIRVTRQGGGQ